MSNKNTLPDKCAVARDLMPLCIDGTASDASQRRVNKHVVDCPPCATVYQEMQTNIELDVPDQQETAQFDTAVKKVKHKHAWRKLRNVLLGIVLALVACAGLAYGYYWYFVEDVPLPIELYEMEINLSTPQRAETPVIIRTKNMPKPAKMHIQVQFDGSVMNDDGELDPSWVMYIWASTTRSTDLDTCGYTDYNYYAFDQTYVAGSFMINNELYKVNSVYRGAPTAEQELAFKPDVKKLKWTTIGNLVLRNVASMDIVGGERAVMPFVTTPSTDMFDPFVTPKTNENQGFAMYGEVKPAQSTPTPMLTVEPQATVIPQVTKEPNAD